MEDKPQYNEPVGEPTFKDAFTGKLLHPVIDYADGMVILGFSYPKMSFEDEAIFLLATANGIRVIRADSFEENGKQYFIDRKRTKRLPSIDKKWGIKKAEAFIKRMNGWAIDPADASKQSLMDQVVVAIKRHIEWETDVDYDLHAAWIIGTYFHRIFNSFPYIHVKAPKGSGKSQCLSLMTNICFNATKGRPTLAALGDIVDAFRATYLIDQAHLLGSPRCEELLDNLTESYRRTGGTRSVMMMEKGREVLEFTTYSPKAFASTKDLPEDLRDRCLILPLMRSRKAFADPDDPDTDWSELRAALYEALLTKHSIVHSLYTVRRIEYKRSGELVGRPLDLWLPIEVMLEVFGAKDKIDEAKRRFLSYYQFAEYAPSEFEEQVFRAVFSGFGDKLEVTLSPKEISEIVRTEYFNPKHDATQRAARIGRTIKKFNLASTSDKKQRSAGFCYLFKKEKIKSVYLAYFETDIESPQPPPPEEDQANAVPF